MNTDNDVNVSRLVTKLGPQPPPVPGGHHRHGGRRRGHRPRRARRPVGNANGILIPAPRRGIILYTVRDAISRDPLTTDLASGFKEVLAELSTIGYRQIEFAGFTQNANAEGGGNLNTVEGATLLRSWLDANGLEAEGNHGSIPSTVTDATIAQFDTACEIAPASALAAASPSPGLLVGRCGSLEAGRKVVCQKPANAPLRCRIIQFRMIWSINNRFRSRSGCRCTRELRGRDRLFFEKLDLRFQT